MGSNDIEAAQPQHVVNIPFEYWIGRLPVTNIQYAFFTKSMGRILEFPEERKMYPFEGISWQSAHMYIMWLNDIYRVTAQAYESKV